MKSIHKVRSCFLAVPLVFMALAAGCETQSEPERAGDLFAQAMEAGAAGNTDQAIELFTKSLEIKPQPYAYLERAKLYLEKGDDKAAIADCQAGLELNSEHRDLQWLLGECKKPKDQRFKGQNAKPPSTGK